MGSKLGIKKVKVNKKYPEKHRILSKFEASINFPRKKS